MNKLLLEVIEDSTPTDYGYSTTVLLQIADMQVNRVCVEKRLSKEQALALEALEEAVAESGAARLALQAVVTFVWNEARGYYRR